jgi:hypothetical protein
MDDHLPDCQPGSRAYALISRIDPLRRDGSVEKVT